MISHPRRSAVLAVAGLLFGAITLLRYTVDAGPGDGIVLLCVLPIVLLAMEFGIIGGAVAALIAFVDFVVWDLVTDAGTPLVGYATRATTFVVLGAMVGRFAHGALSSYDPNRITTLRDLARGMDQRRLVLYYQPIAEAASHRVRSVEALVRWNHPHRGLVPPDQFVPLVETSSLLWDFTSYTIDAAVRQAAEWRARAVTLPIAVNLSSSVVADERLPAEVSRLLERHGVPASALELEITESAIMSDPERSADVLRRLSELGVRLIALDDFGTGHSSLARLHDLPINSLKIDRSFVQRFASDRDNSVIEAIIALASSLGLTTTAEGIEDEDTWQLLAEMGCDDAQGYCLSRPLPPSEFAEWVADREPATT